MPSVPRVVPQRSNRVAIRLGSRAQRELFVQRAVQRTPLASASSSQPSRHRSARPRCRERVESIFWQMKHRGFGVRLAWASDFFLVADCDANMKLDSIAKSSSSGCRRRPSDGDAASVGTAASASVRLDAALLILAQRRPCSRSSPAGVGERRRRPRERLLHGRGRRTDPRLRFLTPRRRRPDANPTPRGARTPGRTPRGDDEGRRRREPPAMMWDMVKPVTGPYSDAFSSL